MGHVSGSHSLEGEKSSVGTQRTSFTLCDLKAWINCVIYKYENNYYFFSSMINYLSCFPPIQFLSFSDSSWGDHNLLSFTFSHWLRFLSPAMHFLFSSCIYLHRSVSWSLHFHDFRFYIAIETINNIFFSGSPFLLKSLQMISASDFLLLLLCFLFYRPLRQWTKVTSRWPTSPPEGLCS